MGKPTGFLEFGRELPENRDPKSRIEDSKEIQLKFDAEKLNKQAARCMDCGVPFCHNGCPLGNNIPEFNDAVYKEDWKEAAEVLFSTNNFPEFTGRICPAPCEASCVLGINKPPVTIEQIEKEIAEKAFELGLVQPNIPRNRTGKKVAVIGSGPAGLAAAAQLNSVGHTVNVYERSDRIGGLLTYGIPDFKLEKRIVERRIKHMRQEGIVFKTNCDIGENVKTADIMDQYDAVVVCTGSTVPRDLPVSGRELDGVHFAMDFLTQENQRVAGDKIKPQDVVVATDKLVALKCICTKPHSCARICPCTNTHTSLTLPVYVHTHTTPFAKKKMARTIVWGFPDMKMMQRMLLCSGRYGPRKTSERRSHRRSETGSKLFSVVYCASA